VLTDGSSGIFRPQLKMKGMSTMYQHVTSLKAEIPEILENLGIFCVFLFKVVRSPETIFINT